MILGSNKFLCRDIFDEEDVVGVDGKNNNDGDGDDSLLFVVILVGDDDDEFDEL